MSMTENTSSALRLAWENPKQILPWRDRGELLWGTCPLVRMEALMCLEAPAPSCMGGVPFGEHTIRDYLNDWLANKVSFLTRKLVFRDSVPELEEVLLCDDMPSYRSALLRVWTDAPCHYKQGMDLSRAKDEAYLRMEHLFFEWYDSGWVARSMFRLRAMNNAPVPPWLADAVQQLDMLFVPYQPVAQAP